MVITATLEEMILFEVSEEHLSLMPRRIIKAFQLRHWQSVSFPLKSVGHRCKYQSDSLQFAVIQGRNQPILLHNNGEKLCLLLYFKASNSQSKLMLEKDPLTFSEVTNRFEETSVVICADPYLLWMGVFFPSFPMAWKWTTVNSVCNCKRFHSSLRISGL